MPTKDGWTHHIDHEKVTLGRKQYRNMEEWQRPCMVCAEPFSIFVRANGNGMVNSSFGLRTCNAHRGERPGANGTADPGEVAKLRSANATMREELDGLYIRLREVFEELQVSKAKLATYELGPAMAAQAVDFDAGRDTTNSALPKLPWER